MGKTWKHNGPEDKFIKKLIKAGKIHRFSKPSKLSADYPEIFSGFTPNVVRNHLNLQKRAQGLYLEGDSDDESLMNDDANFHEPVATSKNENNVHVANTEKEADDSMSGFDSIDHRNYPVICEVYKDPETELDKVALVLTMPAGAQNVTIEVSDGGATATIKYKWIQTTFNMRELFAKMIAAKQITIHHPRVLCIKNGLEKYRNRIDVAPEARIKVTLPITVQTSADSWSFSPVKKDDGTLILLADFTGYIKGYTASIRDVRF